MLLINSFTQDGNMLTVPLIINSHSQVLIVLNSFKHIKAQTSSFSEQKPMCDISDFYGS